MVDIADEQKDLKRGVDHIGISASFVVHDGAMYYFKSVDLALVMKMGIGMWVVERLSLVSPLTRL